MNKAAVIDLGSNSIRMGIFETQNSKLVQTERFREQVRISEGLIEDNLLKDEPVKRTLEAVGRFKEIADSKNIKNIKMIATEALRRAKNSEIFTSKVKEYFGIDVEIIDGIKEAELDARVAGMSVNYNDFYMIDTGGGSVEIALVTGGEVKKTCCLPLGSVVMTEKFRPDENGAADMEKYMTTEILKTEILSEKEIPVVALGGSNKELAKIHMENKKEVDGYVMGVCDAQNIYETLKSLTLKERKNIKGLDIKRADTIVSGLCPLEVLCVLSDAKEIAFCTGSVREGIAAELLL